MAPDLIYLLRNNYGERNVLQEEAADALVEMLAENTRLKAELIEEKAAHFKTHNWLIDRNEELASAEKVREGLIKCYTGMAEDAKRYRWLRMQYMHLEFVIPDPIRKAVFVESHDTDEADAKKLDATIDDAMKEQA